MSNSPDPLTPGAPPRDNKPSREGTAAVSFAVGLFIGILGPLLLFAAFEPARGHPVDYKARNQLLVMVWIVTVAMVAVLAAWIVRFQGHRWFVAGLIAGSLVMGGLCGLLWSGCGPPYGPGNGL
jgi:hypothetical protein